MQLKHYVMSVQVKVEYVKYYFTIHVSTQRENQQLVAEKINSFRLGQAIHTMK